VGIIPWSPLRGGWLSGKYRRGMQAPPEGTRIEEAEKRGWSESWGAYANERTWAIIDTMLAIADATGKSAAQIALRWLLQMPGVTAPIIGARTMKHLEDNLGASGWSLTVEQIERLNQASAKTLPYPHSMIANFSPPRER
jgi:aryl-alcohol dehydrogenase-like predicted oxidoreductase